MPALDELADRIIADRMIELGPRTPDDMPLRRDGRSVTEAATDRRLTLPEILEQEEALIVAADRRMKQPGRDHKVPVPDELTIPQRQLAAAIAGTHQLVLAVGPAGSGKTAALAPGVEQLRRDGRPVFGVAPSATAAEVLAGDAAIDADTLDKLLIEHRLDRPPEHRYDLPTAATIICDEAGMVPTGRMAELFDLADRKGWRLAFVGDPLQFAAVGRGGMFGLLVDTFGSIDLDQIHRFRASWERAASLQLRRGDTTVVDVYEDHDRLHGGTTRQMQRAVVRAWWDATEAGKAASMMAPTNEAVIALNQRAQWLHQQTGHLDEASLEVGPYDVHVGDLISTRANNRGVRTDRNLMVKNRDHWTVEEIHRDGSLIAAGKTGRVRLPAAYVAENVALAYPETSHANQARTVDRSFLHLDGPADVIADALARDWIDRPALQVQAELKRPDATDDVGAQIDLRPLHATELRQLMERNHELTHALAAIRSEQRAADREVTSIVRQHDQLLQQLDGYETRLDSAGATIGEHDRPLHRRKHRTELDAARRELDQLPNIITTTRSNLQRLETEHAQATDRVRRAQQLEKQMPQLLAEHTIVQHKLEHDVITRGHRLATRPPAVLAERLGPVPTDHHKQQLWIDAAGKIAQHNAAFDNRTPAPPHGRARSLDDDVMRASHAAATHSIQRLDRTMEQEELRLERPSLGLSL